MSKLLSNKIPILSQYRYLKLIIWLFFLLPLFLSVILIYRGGKLVQTIHQHDQLLATLSQQISNQQQVKIDEKLINFGNDFIVLFINIPTKQEQQEIYRLSLKKYYAKKFYEQSSHLLFYYQGVHRQLVDKQFYDLKKLKDNIYDVSYVVTYQLSEVDKTSQLIKPVQRKQLLHIPLYINQQKYSVVDFPYFTPLIDYHANYQGLDNYTTAQLATIDRNTFRTFLVDFFKKYASQTVEDMSYMMKYPSSLNNERQFVDLKNFQVFELQHKQLLVKALVLFKDSQFNDMNMETYTLYITRKDNKYFIDNLEHIR